MSQEEDRVREEIAKVLPTTSLCEICYLHKPGNYTRKDCITYSKRLCAYEDMMVGQILSIKGLRIEADDQSLPEKPQLSELCIRKEAMDAQYLKAQQDMLKDNWVKVIGGV